MLGQFFDPEDGGSKFFRNVGGHIPDYIHVISQKPVLIIGIVVEAPNCTNCEDVGGK
jgi:hypothetical protein